jgi:hypothetical protein
MQRAVQAKQLTNNSISAIFFFFLELLAAPVLILFFSSLGAGVLILTSPGSGDELDEPDGAGAELSIDSSVLSAPLKRTKKMKYTKH